jgi:hypothetical protein
MSKKKIMIIAVASLTLITLLVLAVPVLAADSGATQSAQTVPQAGNVKALLRLLLVQDEAKVDALLAQAVSSGKLVPEQAARVKDFWTQHHTRLAKNVILKRLLGAKDEANVQAFLEKAVQAGKIEQAQADKIIQIWEILHAPAPRTNTAN